METEGRESGEIKVPAWVILGTFLIGWVVGPFVITITTLSGDYNVIAYGLGAWLIALPLVATKPLEALGHLMGRR